MKRKRYKSSLKTRLSTQYINTLDQEQKSLYRKAIKLTEQANRRLTKLEKGIDLNRGTYNPKTKRFERKIKSVRGRKISDYMRVQKGTWATKKLNERIEEYYNLRKNRIELKSNMSTPRLRLVIKAIRKFLQSETSTLEGVNKVKESVLNSIRLTVGDIDNITEDDVETLYDFFNDPDFKDVTNEITGSPDELWVALATSKSDDLDPEQFLNRIRSYVFTTERGGLNSTMQEKLLRIYEKFMSN